MIAGTAAASSSPARRSTSASTTPAEPSLSRARTPSHGLRLMASLARLHLGGPHIDRHHSASRQ
jgi:hypothetical protein